MPAVKKLHNESENVTKPEWMRGHYFGALALLLEAGYSLKAVPVILGLQDGIKTSEEDETRVETLLSKIFLPEYNLIRTYATALIVVGILGK